MPEIRPAIEAFAKIKVVGVGGSGGSAVNRMIDAKIRGVEFVVMNTDVQALQYSDAPNKLQLGEIVARGLGAGMDPDLGLRAAEESQNEIREILKGADMVFIACGLGGGTGSGAAPKVAEIARELGILTVAVVTKPFPFEGFQRTRIAEDAHQNLVQFVDTIITIPNERILQIIDRRTSMKDAFNIVDDVLRQGVQGISDIISVPGLINVDFADARSVMQNRGSALMGIGRGHGDTRAVDAAKAAVASPLLDISIEGARGILFTVTGSSSLGMHEVNEAAQIITEYAHREARIIFGATIDESMGDDLKITVMATGFDCDSAQHVEPAPKPQPVSVPAPTMDFSRPTPSRAPNPRPLNTMDTGFRHAEPRRVPDARFSPPARQEVPVDPVPRERSFVRSSPITETPVFRREDQISERDNDFEKQEERSFQEDYISSDTEPPVPKSFSREEKEEPKRVPNKREDGGGIAEIPAWFRKKMM